MHLGFVTVLKPPEHKRKVKYWNNKKVFVAYFNFDGSAKIPSAF